MNLSPGVVNATVAAMKFGYTQGKKEQIAVQFCVKTLEMPEFITGYLYFTDKCIEITERALTAMGWDFKANGWAIDEMVQMQPLTGNEVRLVLGNETYEGTTRLKVQWINDVGGGDILSDEGSDSDVQKFSALLKARLGGPKKAKSALKKEKMIVEDPLEKDDPLPF